MAMVIENNLAAQMTLGEMNKNNNKLGKQLKKVSSGMRINGAGDDASGYAIGKRMEVMKRALGQDIQNSQTGRNLVRVAEGGIQEIINNMRSMKELALNSANDTNTDLDRATIEKEFSSRMVTIRDIATETNYNGKLLLNGDYREPKTVQRTISQTFTQPGNVNYRAGYTIQYVDVPEVVQHYIIKENTVDGLTDKFSAMQWTKKTGTTTRRSLECDTYAYGPSRWNGDGVMKADLEDLRRKRDSGAVLTDEEKKSLDLSSTKNIKIDFSGVTKPDGGNVTWLDLDEQGFIIMCAGCEQFINIRFEGTMGVGSGEYHEKIPNTTTDPSWHSSDHEYVIGVGGLQKIEDLPAVLFEGIQNAVGRPTDNDTATDLYIDSRHNVRIKKGEDGEYYFSKGESYRNDGTDTSPDFLIYSKGIKLASESETVIRQQARYVYTGDVAETIDEVITVEKEITENDPGNPLIIHTGPRANQELHVFINDMKPEAMGLDKASVVTREKATDAIQILDDALTYALNENTRMGAYQSRLDFTVDNLVTAEENTTASLSTIRDADMAREMMEYTKANVLLQASQSMLAQANQNSSQVMSLLQ